MRLIATGKLRPEVAGETASADDFGTELIFAVKQLVRRDPHLHDRLLLVDREDYTDWMESNELAFARLDLMHNYGNNMLETLISDLRSMPGWDFLGAGNRPIAKVDRVRMRKNENRDFFEHTLVQGQNGLASEQGCYTSILGEKGLLRGLVKLPGFYNAFVRGNPCIRKQNGICVQVWQRGQTVETLLQQLCDHEDNRIRVAFSNMVDVEASLKMNTSGSRATFDLEAEDKISIFDAPDYSIVVIFKEEKEDAVTVALHALEHHAAAVRRRDGAGPVCTYPASQLCLWDWKHGADAASIFKSKDWTAASITPDTPYLTNHALGQLVILLYPREDKREFLNHYGQSCQEEIRVVERGLIRLNGNIIQIRFVPCGDGAYLRAACGISGAGSRKPHTDSCISAVMSGTLFLRFLERMRESAVKKTATGSITDGGGGGGGGSGSGVQSAEKRRAVSVSSAAGRGKLVPDRVRAG